MRPPIPLLLILGASLSGTGLVPQYAGAQALDRGDHLDLRITAEGRYAAGDEFRYAGSGSWTGWGPWTGLGTGVEPAGRLGGFDVSGRLLIPVRVERGAAPVPVVEFSVSRDGGGFSYGRHRSRGASLVARGGRIKGMRGSLDLGKVTFEFLQGETRSAREGRADPETGEVEAWGRYRRSVSNLNLSAEPTEGLRLRMSLAEGGDDPGSIAYGLERERNAAAGAEIEYRSGKSRVHAALGRSRTVTRDPAGGALPRNGSAWEVEGRTRVGPHALQVESYSADRGYHSFAGQSRPDDRRGFGIADRFRVLDEHLALAVGYDMYRDNLDGTAATTTTVERPWMKVELETGSGLPALDVALRGSRNTARESGDSRDRERDSFRSGALGLSGKWSIGASQEVSSSLRFSYSDRNGAHGDEQNTRELAAGTRLDLGVYETRVEAAWSERRHSTPELGRSRISLDLLQEIAAVGRIGLETRARLETFRYRDGSRRNRVEIRTDMDLRVIRGKLSLSARYRYRSTRIENEDIEDWSGDHGVFLAVNVAETIRLLGDGARPR